MVDPYLDEADFERIQILCEPLKGKENEKLTKRLLKGGVQEALAHPDLYLNDLNKAREEAVKALDKKYANGSPEEQALLPLRKQEALDEFNKLQAKLLKIANQSEQERAATYVRTTTVSSKEPGNSPYDANNPAAKEGLSSGEKIYQQHRTGIIFKEDSRIEVWSVPGKERDSKAVKLTDYKSLDKKGREKGLDLLVNAAIATFGDKPAFRIDNFNINKYKGIIGHEKLPYETNYHEQMFGLMERFYVRGKVLADDQLMVLPKEDRQKLDKMRAEFLDKEQVAKNLREPGAALGAAETLGDGAPRVGVERRDIDTELHADADADTDTLSTTSDLSRREEDEEDSESFRADENVSEEESKKKKEKEIKEEEDKKKEEEGDSAEEEKDEEGNSLTIAPLEPTGKKL